MTKKSLDENKILCPALKDLIRHTPPEVHLKKNDLSLSVEHGFNSDKILIKLIARYKTWIDLELKCLAQDQIVGFCC